MTYLNPVRHRLNLTVRGQVFVRKVVIDGRRGGPYVRNAIPALSA
jgi:hypothetical protein